MNQLSRVTKYFMKSLVDSKRLVPSDREILSAMGEASDADMFVRGPTVWEHGRVDPELTQRLIERAEDHVESIPLTLYPRVDRLYVEDGQTVSYRRQIRLPLAVPCTLNSSGQLSPCEQPPYIPRNWLAPSVGADNPIATPMRVGRFMRDNPYERVKDWEDLKQYCIKLMQWLFGGSSETLATFVLDREPYHCLSDILLQTEGKLKGATARLYELLDIMKESQTFPPLYRNLCASEDEAPIPMLDPQKRRQLSRWHVGQMTGAFALAENQRVALHHLIAQQDGEILAVNGPPGTGKTTLIRSVVANLWVQRALEGGEAPIVVAVSNNNQAVTNILDSFAAADEEGICADLSGRWLPDLDSYGLYWCSEAKVGNEYLHQGPGSSGGLHKFQNREYLEQATELFLEKASSWKEESIDSVKEAVSLLQHALHAKYRELVDGEEACETFGELRALVEKRFGSLESMGQHLTQLEGLVEGAKEAVACEKQLLDRFYQHLQERGILTSFFMWLPPVRRRERMRLARFLLSVNLELAPDSELAVEEELSQRLRRACDQLSDYEKQLKQLYALSDQFHAAENALSHWIARRKPEHLQASTLEGIVDEINDRVVRLELFKIATHYWEGRWLLETRQFVDANDDDRVSPRKLVRKLRRFAKLTPCFVSTFYMVPSAFSAWERMGEQWICRPQFEQIDLLIVDEAGQGLAEVAAPTFALAKRALVIGDTDQIQPIWVLPPALDRANLQTVGLECRLDFTDFWLQSGLLSSNGCLMRVAQRRCQYHQIPSLQRGLYLTEHRRCYDRIISFCNALVYDNFLVPCRGNPRKERAWEEMLFIPVYESSTRHGCSRVNIGEAKAIAEWVAREQELILAQSGVGALGLGGALAVVTPFRKQAALIRKELASKGITGVTVGTIHQLQGAERSVILFSSVYGSNEGQGRKFYDQGHHMLNVAVSRAKDAFIVFGHPDVFGTTPNTPSAVLRSHLKAAPLATTAL